MKKTIILGLALVVLFVGAATTYANTNSTYAAWTSLSPNNNAPVTPHKNYTITTNKCAVCHAVHKATATGEVLLRSSVADACTYCHIDTDIGIIRVYNATSTAYTTDSSVTAFGGGFAHTSEAGGVTCAVCHAVHGAKTLAGGNDSKILKDWNSWGSTQTGGFLDYSTLALAKFGPLSSDIAAVVNKYNQQTAWCTGCHKYFIESYDESQTWVQQTTLAGNITAGNSFVNYGSHVMTDANAAYANPASGVTTKVAWAGSNTCRACHDAGDVDSPGGPVVNSWPHYTPNFYRFMGVAATQSVSTTTVADNANTNGTEDGLCLKCHVDSTNTYGVNKSF